MSKKDFQVIKKIDKPWGHELIWAHTEKYAGKILHIRKGEMLSYQYHDVKDETIFLYSGLMEIDMEDGKKRKRVVLNPGEGIRILPHTKHRMIALEDCEVLEVSTPELSDVVRLEDRYGRTVS
ncbi:MAG: cupin domain-containing protein [Nitrospirota bacterium]